MIFTTKNIDRFENKEQVAFDTYLSYLTGISNSIQSSIETNYVFLNEITESKAFQKIQTKKNIDIDKISKLLRNAWYTEFQLNNLSITPDFAGFSLHWGQVYAYYSCYLQIRVYLISQNKNVNPKHRTTLKQFSEELKTRKQLFPTPWKILCDDDPSKNVFINKLESFKDHHQLSNEAKLNPIDNFAKFLKTTRKKEIDRKCKEWKDEHKKNRTPRQVREKFINTTPPTSIYDCLYRLRIRANYENADTFIFSNIPDEQSKQFHDSLKNIVWISSLILETISAKYISSKNYKLILDKYENTLKNKIQPKDNLDPMKRYNLFKEKIK